MGPKGSASYFQEQMATVVLVCLVYHICELYLDDSLSYSSSGEELVFRLRQIFKRFHIYKITINPDKSELGLQTIEYTGHVIDETGLSFTETKLSGVKAFLLPNPQKQLKSFFGLANYFRDHVRNLSILVNPLQSLLLGYSPQTRNLPVRWTDAMKAAFEKEKEAVAFCQKLFF